MSKLLNHKGIFYLLIIAFLSTTVLAPTQSFASWEDKSDELPGSEDNEIVDTLLIVAGILLIGGIIYWIATMDSNKDKPEVEDKKSEAQSDSSATSFNDTEFQAELSLNILSGAKTSSDTN